MKKIIKKGDIALLAAFLAAAILIACIPMIRSAADNSSDTAGASDPAGAPEGTGASEVVITIAGDTYGTYPLSEDRVIEIRNSYGTNEVTIQGGSVSVTKSDCANQICVDTGAIRTEGQMIICLPHRLSVEIRAGHAQEEEYDAIVR